MPSTSITRNAAPAPRVLVVDDNRDAADSTAQLLQLLGAEVRVAYDGAAALQQLDGWWPAMALLDLGMPEMDGVELGSCIRARLGGASPVLVALTGWGQADDRARTLAAGFQHHLVKPIDPQRLEGLLASLVPLAPLAPPGA